MPAPGLHVITLLLADASELFRAGIKALLGERRERTQIQVVGEAVSAAAAVTETMRLRPSVVLLDISLPDGPGFEACRQILSQRPDTRVLFLTSVIDDQLVYDAMNCGAHGYLLKDVSAVALWQAIADVMAGKFILDPAVTARVLNLVRSGAPRSEQDKLALLSAQERRVLALVAEGKTNKEIATQLGLSDKTVKNYLSNAFEKLQITRRSQAAVLYAENRPRNKAVQH